jgi:dTDP-4-dehydrorhamnose 3,5-epimerase
MLVFCRLSHVNALIMHIKHNKILDGVILTPLKKIGHPKGDVFHAMKLSDEGFCGFGEAYFSTVNKSEIKGWKKHTKMILNLVVPIGEIEFVVYDGSDFFSVKLSKYNYQRLTIKPNLWLAFKGLSDENMLLNLASIEHTPAESENTELHNFNYDWSGL